MPTPLAITAFGSTKSAEEWAREPGCSVSGECIRRRIKDGWPAAIAIASPSLNQVSKLWKDAGSSDGPSEEK